MSVEASRTGSCIACVFELGVFGGQALLGVVKRGGLAVGVAKGFERADRVVLVHVGFRIVQRLDPVAREDGGVLFGSALGCGDHGAAMPFERGHGASAGARGIDDQLALGGYAIAEGGEVRRGNVGAGKIEFVLDAVERAVADQGQDEIVIRLGLGGDLRERVGEMRARGVGAGERVDMDIAARGFQQLVEIHRQRGEALLVFGLAAQARHGDVINRRARGNREQERGRETDRENGGLHTIPHFRRSSHSAKRRARISRKIAGMSHSSLVSRTVIPASE